MSGLDEILERLAGDPEFRRRLEQDPRATLVPYDLTTEELRHLADRIAGDDAARSAVDRRTGRAAMFDLLARGAGDPRDNKSEIQ